MRPHPNGHPAMHKFAQLAFEASRKYGGASDGCGCKTVTSNTELSS
jgi:hypothetical protein